MARQRRRGMVSPPCRGSMRGSLAIKNKDIKLTWLNITNDPTLPPLQGEDYELCLCARERVNERCCPLLEFTPYQVTGKEGWPEAGVILIKQKSARACLAVVAFKATKAGFPPPRNPLN